MSKEMLVNSGVLSGEEIIDVDQASRYALERVHDPEYIRKIEEGTLSHKEQMKLGLPIAPGLYSRSSVEAEATRMAVHAALEEGVSVCLAGGTHNAFREHGEGFCVFNDVAVAIRDLQQKQPNIKIMVVDTDAHQGNGTNSLIGEDKNVFTYSIHVGLNYQTRKVNGSMDVETVRYVEGDLYLDQLFMSLAKALDDFQPDLVIWVSGADVHKNDRFGQMMLGIKDLSLRDEVILSALIKNRIPVTVLYGGGYNRELDYTAKIHRNTVATAKRLATQYRGL